MRTTVLVCLVLGFPTAHAVATTVFSTETSFLAAASTVIHDGFESYPLRTQQVAPIVADDFTITSNGQLGLPIGSGEAGLHPTDGNHFVVSNGTDQIGLPPEIPATVTFTFEVPVTVFGVHINDFGDTGQGGVLSFDNGIGDTGIVASAPQSSGTENFFGIISDNSFLSLTFSRPGHDGVAFDEVYYAPVPEPSTGCLFFVGALVLLLRCFGRVDSRRHVVKER